MKAILFGTAFVWGEPANPGRMTFITGQHGDKKTWWHDELHHHIVRWYGIGNDSFFIGFIRLSGQRSESRVRAKRPSANKE